MSSYSFTGGGFALASASQKSGLSDLMVNQLNQLNLQSLPSWLVSYYFLMLAKSTYTKVDILKIYILVQKIYHEYQIQRIILRKLSVLF